MSVKRSSLAGRTFMLRVLHDFPLSPLLGYRGGSVRYYPSKTRSAYRNAMIIFLFCAYYTWVRKKTTCKYGISNTQKCNFCFAGFPQRAQ